MSLAIKVLPFHDIEVGEGVVGVLGDWESDGLGSAMAAMMEVNGWQTQDQKIR